MLEKIRKKVCIALCCLGIVVSFFVFGGHVVYAHGIESLQETNMSEGILRGDVIKTIYRMNNGHLQYRHWNATQGYWVEDHWITLE